MRRLLNPTIALITFAIGVLVATIWQISQRENFLASEAVSVSTTLKPGRPADSETETADVYSAVIKDMYLGDGIKLLVIQNADDCPSASIECPLSDGKVDEMRREMEEWAFNSLPALQRETIDDFHSNARKCYSLRRNLDIPVKYVERTPSIYS